MAFMEQVSQSGALKSSVLEALLRWVHGPGADVWSQSQEETVTVCCCSSKRLPIAWDVFIYPAWAVLQPAFTT